MQLLDELRQQGTPEVGQAFILEYLDLDKTKRLRDIFKHSDAWGTLVVDGVRKGTYRLAP